MNACANWKDRLLDYALGALSSSSAKEMESHLQSCSACAAALAELRARREQLEAALAHLVASAEPSPDFRARVLAAAEASRGRRVALPAWAGALAAVTAVLLASVLISRFSPPGAGPTPLASPSLSTWRSPTESLLHSPAQDYLHSAPRLGEFYFSLEPAPPEAGS